MSKLLKAESIKQLLRFSIVGISNTLITAVTIYITLELLDWSAESSNFLGYVLGLVNSYIWNSKWTFKSQYNKSTLIKFILVFLYCYALQLYTVLRLNGSPEWFNILDEFLENISFLSTDYANQLLGILVFTTFNFFLNKYITYNS